MEALNTGVVKPIINFSKNGTAINKGRIGEKKSKV